MNPRGAIVKVARILPGPNDAKIGLDDLLIKDGSPGVNQIVENAKPMLDWLLDDAEKAAGKERVSLLKTAFRFLGSISPIEAGMHKARLKELGVDGNTFRAELKAAQATRQQRLERRRIESEDAQASENDGENLTVAERAELFRLAEPLLTDPGLLFKVGKEIQARGVAGEDRNIRIIYVATSSQKRDKSISITVKGDSSAGKNYVVDRSLTVIPSSAYISLTGMSRQAMLYSERSYKHKTVVIFEKHGMSQAEYNIRSLQSEGRIVFEVTVKDPETGRFTTQEVEKEGPTNFIITTTDATLHEENETRHWTIMIDETEEQTERVKDKNAEMFELEEQIDDRTEYLKVWHAVYESLEPVRVVIPYARWLARETPNKPQRIRRDLNKLLIFIETIAYLHQYQRRRKDTSSGAIIYAGIQDYFMAYVLLQDVFAPSLLEYQQKTSQYVNALKDCYQKKAPLGLADAGVTLGEIAGATGRSNSSVSRWLRPAIDAGYVEVVKKTGRGVEAVKPGRGLPDISASLPSVESLAKAFPDLASSFSAVDPVTGDEMTFQIDGHQQGVCASSPTQRCNVAAE